MSKDVHMTIAIDTGEALHGTMRTLLLPTGGRATITIPADVYDGQILWFPSYVKDTEQDTDPGTLFLTVQIGPQPEVTDHDKDAALTPSTPVQSAISLPTAQPDETSPPASANPTLAPPALTPDQPLPSHSTPVSTDQRLPLNKKIILVAAALLVIVGSGGMFFTGSISRAITQAHATATAGAIANNATATSHTDDATATSIVSGIRIAAASTATVQAQGTASVVTASPNPYASGTLIFYDKLDGTSEDQATMSTWKSSPGCTFSNGALHALDADLRYLTDCQVPGQHRNFTIEVKASILRGDTAQIYFRGIGMLHVGYFFMIDSNGHYQLLREGESALMDSKYTTLLRGSSAAIRQGYNQTNLLAIVTQDSTIMLYVNGQKIDSTTDTNFKEGDVGLVASSYSNTITGTTEVAFSDLRIWQIGK